ncbi:MAG: SDR family oxidoreductase [Deltaproteobacteria bacterium]
MGEQKSAVFRKKVLITGATGYIGRRLQNRLLERSDLAIRLLVRNRRKVGPCAGSQVEIIEGDTFNPAQLALALQSVHTAYYLIHSMGEKGRFADLDRQSAMNFRDACIAARVRRIIYLGGLGLTESASEHLLSRLETGEILSSRRYRIQTIWLRAGVIIGSGSASFEIIRNLVQKLPVMVTPRWVKTLSQPIAVADVVAYLEAAIDLRVSGNLVIDIGSEEAMSFRDMMLRAARVMGLRRFLLPVPFLSPRLSSYWLMLFTPVPYGVAAALVEGLKSETLLQNNNAAIFFPAIRPMAYEEAVEQAIKELVHDEVVSRWCDSSGGVCCDIEGRGDPGGAILRDRRTVDLSGFDPIDVFAAMTSIGGENGWFTYHFLWRLRGLIDKVLGGYGLNRGRRARGDLRPGDALDFWKVADIKPGKRLLLWSQMKLPGEAWLEFEIQGDSLVQTAHYLPRGIWGRVYWYAVKPLHNLVFADLANKIVGKAKMLNV